MKRLLSIIALAALVAMSLVSCKPDSVKLHPSVGTLYDSQTATSVSKPTMGADGVVFYVNESEGYALICSMNDLKQDRQSSSSMSMPHQWISDFTWSVFGQDTLMERDTITARVTRGIKYYVEKRDSFESERTAEYGEKFTKYVYETRDSVIDIYPMLRYKAKTERGAWVKEGVETPVNNLGPIGALVLGEEKALARVSKTDYRPRGADTAWNADTVRVLGSDYPIKIGGFLAMDDTVLARVKDSLVERRVKVWMTVADHYADTLWCGVRKGDRMVLGSDNKGMYTLDTNWCFGLIPGLGENDEDGAANTDKIVNSDVPVKQRLTPDSASAARVCRQYFTRAYVENKYDFAADTLFKSTTGKWFLPSRKQLQALYDARTKINEQHANTLGFELLQNCYWSSNPKGAAMAYYKCFTDNGVESYIPKANNYYRVNIRAVRRVEWPLEKK